MPYASYEEACATHRWVVPERYNIAADVCDRHPREALAMIHEHWAGEVREVRWGELQDLAGKAANVLAALGVGRGDRVAVVLPATPETAAVRGGACARRGWRAPSAGSCAARRPTAPGAGSSRRGSTR